MIARAFPRAAGFAVCLGAALFLGGCSGPGRTRGAAQERRELRETRDREFAEIEDGPTVTVLPDTADPVDAGTDDDRPKPGWIASGFSPRYPSSRFMLGMGSARETEAAERTAALADQRARAELASEVRVRVAAEFRSAAELATAEGATKTDTTAVYEQLVSNTDIELPGARVADRWRDPETGVWWSLAVLDRQRFASGLAERARALRAAVEQERRAAIEAPKDDLSVRRLRRTNQALEQALELVRIRAQLAALGADPGAPADVELLAELWRRSKALRSKMPVGLVAFAGPASGALEAKLSSALSGMGFPVVAFDPPGMPFDEIKTAAPDGVRRRFPGVAFVAAASVESAEIGEAEVARLRVVFHEARGQAALREVAEGALVAASTIENPARTRRAHRVAERAQREALAAGVDELVHAFSRDVADALAIP